GKKNNTFDSANQPEPRITVDPCPTLIVKRGPDDKGATSSEDWDSSTVSKCLSFETIRGTASIVWFSSRVTTFRRVFGMMLPVIPVELSTCSILSASSRPILRQKRLSCSDAAKARASAGLPREMRAGNE